MISDTYLESFVAESNEIEGIYRVLDHEIDAHKLLLSKKVLNVAAISFFVRVVAGASIRDNPLLNVRVGEHVPPRGGKFVVDELAAILKSATFNKENCYVIHQKYEHLHPFMDGNGRSGRAIWLWQRVKFGPKPTLTFRHHFYYEALENWRQETTKD